MKKYDVIVVGGGGAGITAAFTAKGFGKKTLIVERNKLGGECTWAGCIPSKGLIHIASESHGGKTIDPMTVLPRVRAVSETVYKHEDPEVFAKRGIDTIQGDAKFVNRNTLVINNEEYRAKKIILALGSEPQAPPIEGLDSTPHLDNENFFTQEKLPQSLIVIGGGPIGLELSQASVRLGTEVTLLEVADTLLPREEPEAAEIVVKALKSDGIAMHTGVKIHFVKGDLSRIEVKVTIDGEEKTLVAEALLVAAGRKPRTDEIGLDIAGVAFNKFGIIADKHLKTSNPNIYVCGDVVGPYRLSHMAEYQGKTATLNAILPFKTAVNYTHLPWVIFTDPEVAHTGLTQQESEQKFGAKNIYVYTLKYDEFDRGMTSDEEGVIKVICNKKMIILGAHVTGPRAGEILSSLQMLKSLDIPIHKLHKIVLPYPVYSDAIRKIAKKAVLDKLFNHPVVKIFLPK